MRIKHLSFPFLTNSIHSDFRERHTKERKKLFYFALKTVRAETQGFRAKKKIYEGAGNEIWRQFKIQPFFRVLL